ncbi:hypothetical protein FOPE_02428 [Fonsecaea pedrosoi]|nr:hypothetical protein FOPE_02428 [Fonsecaea pedrosoi]
MVTIAPRDRIGLIGAQPRRGLRLWYSAMCSMNPSAPPGMLFRYVEVKSEFVCGWKTQKAEEPKRFYQLEGVDRLRRSSLVAKILPLDDEFETQKNKALNAF